MGVPTESPTTEASTEAPTVAPTTEASTESPTVAPATEKPTKSSVKATTKAPGSKFKCGDNVLILKGAKKKFVNHKATIVKYLRGKKKWGLQLANSKKIAVGECFLMRIETSQSSTVASTTEAPKQDRRLRPTTEAPKKSPTVT